MQTAKSVQLTTKEGVNISPTTDLMSVYYEVLTDDGVIARKYIYNDFPVGVSYVNVSLNNLTVSNDTQQFINIGNNQKIQYKDNDGQSHDITVSDISVQKLSGTNYNVIHSNNYNLSEILYNYESKYAFDISINECSVYANNLAMDNYVYFNNQYVNIQKDVSNISNNCSKLSANMLTLSRQVNTALITYDNSNIYTVSDLRSLCNTRSLTANKIYMVFYEPTLSNINISNKHQTTTYGLELRDVSTKASGIYQKYILYLKAKTISSFYPEVQLISGIYPNNNIIDLQWQAKYDLTNNTITWLKDEYNNEAPYDFKHTVFNVSVNNITYSLYTFTEYRGGKYVEKTSVNQAYVYNNKIIQNTYPTILCACGTICNNDIDTDAFTYIDANIITNNNIKNSDVIWVCQNTGTQISEQVSQTNILNSEITYVTAPAHNNLCKLNNITMDTAYLQLMNSSAFVQINNCNFYYSKIYVPNQNSSVYSLSDSIIYDSRVTFNKSYVNNNVIYHMPKQSTQQISFLLQSNNVYYANVSMYATGFNVI